MNTEERIEKLEHQIQVLVRLKAHDLYRPFRDFREPKIPDPEFDQLLADFKTIANEVSAETAPLAPC